jgi:Ethanolamine utilization protein EutJ (predicted chaperonin)
MGKIGNIPIQIGNMTCNVVFMVVDTYNNDVLLGLDFLIKIGVVVDMECILIQIRHGPKANV